jgi:hypothetical protein
LVAYILLGIFQNRPVSSTSSTCWGRQHSASVLQIDFLCTPNLTTLLISVLSLHYFNHSLLVLNSSNCEPEDLGDSHFKSSKCLSTSFTVEFETYRFISHLLLWIHIIRCLPVSTIIFMSLNVLVEASFILIPLNLSFCWINMEVLNCGRWYSLTTALVFTPLCSFQ